MLNRILKGLWFLSPLIVAILAIYIRAQHDPALVEMMWGNFRYFAGALLIVIDLLFIGLIIFSCLLAIRNLFGIKIDVQTNEKDARK